MHPVSEMYSPWFVLMVGRRDSGVPPAFRSGARRCRYRAEVGSRVPGYGCAAGVPGAALLSGGGPPPSSRGRVPGAGVERRCLGVAGAGCRCEMHESLDFRRRVPGSGVSGWPAYGAGVSRIPCRVPVCRCRRVQVSPRSGGWSRAGLPVQGAGVSPIRCRMPVCRCGCRCLADPALGAVVCRCA